MELRIWVSTGVVAIVIGLTGCTDDQNDPAARQAEPSPSSATPTPRPARTPLDGKWLSHLTPGEYTQRLDRAGLGRWTDDFLTGEEVLDGENPVVYRFGDGQFTVGYYVPGQPWHVGWKGIYRVSGQQVELYDDFSEITDTFRWRVKGDRLRLTWMHSDADEIDGIPLEVYFVSYLGGWLARTGCTMDAGDDCLDSPS